MFQNGAELSGTRRKDFFFFLSSDFRGVYLRFFTIPGYGLVRTYGRSVYRSSRFVVCPVAAVPGRADALARLQAHNNAGARFRDAPTPVVRLRNEHLVRARLASRRSTVVNFSLLPQDDVGSWYARVHFEYHLSGHQRVRFHPFQRRQARRRAGHGDGNARLVQRAGPRHVRRHLLPVPRRSQRRQHRQPDALDHTHRELRRRECCCDGGRFFTVIDIFLIADGSGPAVCVRRAAGDLRAARGRVHPGELDDRLGDGGERRGHPDGHALRNGTRPESGRDALAPHL